VYVVTLCIICIIYHVLYFVKLQSCLFFVRAQLENGFDMGEGLQALGIEQFASINTHSCSKGVDMLLNILLTKYILESIA